MGQEAGQKPRPALWRIAALAALPVALLALVLVVAHALRDPAARLQRLDLEALRLAAVERPNDARFLLQVGQRLRQLGERADAFAVTSRAYDLSEGDARFAAAMAGAFLDQGNLPAAERLLTDAVARWPDAGEIRAQFSRLHAERGQFTDALREAETAVRLAPGHAGAWQALGRARAANKRPDAAFDAFDQARQLAPGDVELLADHGEALATFGRSAEAETVLTAALALAPNAARPASVLGRLKAERARTPQERAEARRLLERALARLPQSPELRYHLSMLAMRDGNAPEAIRHLEACLEQDPGYGEAHLALGQLYRKSGREADARRAFAAWRRFSDYRREATHLELRLRREPENRALLRRMAALHAAHGNARRADEFRRRLQDLEAGRRTDAGILP